MVRMSPEEIYDKRFGKVRRGGYDPEEVERFLDRVHASYKDAVHENEETQGKLRSALLEVEELRSRTRSLEAAAASAKAPAASEDEVALLREQLATMERERDEAHEEAELATEELEALREEHAALEQEAEGMRDICDKARNWSICAAARASEEARELLEKARADAQSDLEDKRAKGAQSLYVVQATLADVQSRLEGYAGTMREVRSCLQAFLEGQRSAILGMCEDMESVLGISSIVCEVSSEVDEVLTSELGARPYAQVELEDDSVEEGHEDPDEGATCRDMAREAAKAAPARVRAKSGRRTSADRTVQAVEAPDSVFRPNDER